MRPVRVSELEIQRGIEEPSRFLPNPSHTAEYWAEMIAEAIFYDAVPDTWVWTPRLQFDQEDALRHLRAIMAARRMHPKEKLRNMAVLITLWYSRVGEPE